MPLSPCLHGQQPNKTSPAEAAGPKRHQATADQAQALLPWPDRLAATAFVKRKLSGKSRQIQPQPNATRPFA
ncbi:MAG: hypothetical protein Q4A11_01550 [Brachymonas sp.]|nr:hypothetical protein [Brachymonas sp.]